MFINFCKQQNTINDTELKEVEKFTHLGCEIRRDSNIWNEVGIRIGKLGSAFTHSTKFGTLKNIPLYEAQAFQQYCSIIILIYE